MFTVKLEARLQFQTLADLHHWFDELLADPHTFFADYTLEDDPESNGEGLVDPADFASMLISEAERNGLDLGNAIPDMLAEIENEGKIRDLNGTEPITWLAAVCRALEAALPTGK